MSPNTLTYLLRIEFILSDAYTVCHYNSSYTYSDYSQSFFIQNPAIFTICSPCNIMGYYNQHMNVTDNLVKLIIISDLKLDERIIFGYLKTCYIVGIKDPGPGIVPLQIQPKKV